MKKTAIILIAAVALGACQVFTPAPPTATPIPPTATPVPPTELTVCLGTEPESLYPYRGVSRAAQVVMQVIFDVPLDWRSAEPSAVILEKIPNLADSSAYFSPVGVSAGDVVLNTAGEVISLQSGVQVFPTGCTSPDCAVTWDGSTPVQMDQLTANFQLKPGLVWSDGLPLKASDSEYAFTLASDPATPTSKLAVDKTAAYRAVDDLNVQWVSKPGFAADDIADYFWLPLPEHAWGATSAADLLTADAANRSPVGWGPYMLETWTAGQGMRLVKNPSYFRAGEGLPFFDILNFKFIGRLDGTAALDAIAGCDLVDASALNVESLTALQPGLEGSGYRLVSHESRQLELLAFGITPASYDDNYYPHGVDRPDIFGDARTRQAIAACIDRQGIADNLLDGLAGVANSWLPASDALLAGVALAQYPYDPNGASALLDEAGWRDLDQNPATARAHGGNVRVPFGTPLELSLLAGASALQGEIANKIASDLNTCGIQVNVTQLPANELFKAAPDGPVFGRQFDMALLPVEVGSGMRCDLFTTAEIPTAANMWIGSQTGGANYFGYSNPAYDSECARLKNAGLDSGIYSQSSTVLLQTLNADLPFIPLFHFPQGSLVRDGICMPEDLQDGQIEAFKLCSGTES